MSAFLVPNETIRWVVAAAAQLGGDYGATRFNHGNAGEVGEQCDELGRELLRINHKSLYERYGEPMPNEIEYRHKGLALDGIGDWVCAVKQIACWAYQSCEGNVPETEPLFNKIDHNLRAEASTKVMRMLPQWEAAPWSIEDGEEERPEQISLSSLAKRTA